MTHNSKTGAAFIAGGTIAGGGVSATVGGIGLAGGFGAVGIGTVPEDVKDAYLRLARLYHPDVNSSTQAKAAMQAINRAYRQYRQKINGQTFIV